MNENNLATLSVQQAADALDVHYMTAYRYVRTGLLPATMVGGRWRIRLEDLEQRLEHIRPGATEPTASRRRSVEHRRRMLLDRLAAGDEQGSWAIVDAALLGGFDPVTLHLELIAPVVAAIGDGWEEGTITVAQEHRAAAVAHRIVGRLGPRFVRRGRRRGVAVLAGAPDDAHALPIALAADVVRAAGYDVVDLGASVPPEDLARTALDADRLVAVGICVSVSGNEAAVRDAVACVHDAVPGCPVLVGGNGIDAAAALALGAAGHGGDAAELVSLLTARSPVSA